MNINKFTNERNMSRKPKPNKLQLRITDDELETLNTISFEDDESVSQVVRKAIRVYNTYRNNNKRDYF